MFPALIRLHPTATACALPTGEAAVDKQVHPGPGISHQLVDTRLLRVDQSQRRVCKPATDDSDGTINITTPRMLAPLGSNIQSPGIEITGDSNALQTLNHLANGCPVRAASMTCWIASIVIWACSLFHTSPEWVAPCMTR